MNTRPRQAAHPTCPGERVYAPTCSLRLIGIVYRFKTHRMTPDLGVADARPEALACEFDEASGPLGAERSGT